MSWDEILEHRSVLEAFRRAAARGRLASTFLFVGPPGVGKRTFAMKLAQALLCETNSESQLEPCGECWSCLHLAAGTHPDLEFVQVLPGERDLLLEQFIGDREHRNKEGLCPRIALKPVRGGRKIAIIDDADRMTNPAVANVLLKTLEEPPPRSVLILIGTSAQRQLPTIRSRSQIVRFGPLSEATVERLLVDRGLVEDPATAKTLAGLSEGSVQQALDLADPELRRFRELLFESLRETPLDSARLAKTVGAFVDSAGKDAPIRRVRLKQTIGWAVDYFRGEMWRATNDNAESAAVRIELCLDAIGQVDANANQTTLIDAWLAGLAHHA